MLRFLALAICYCCFLAGCGGSGPQSVSGTVTVNGQPLAAGEIQFEPTDATKGADAGQIKDGQFSFKAKPGSVKVKITAMRDTGKTVVGAMGEQLPAMEQYLPPKYNTATELTAEVKSGGGNKYTFALDAN
jgi:hypothetical protein